MIGYITKWIQIVALKRQTNKAICNGLIEPNGVRKIKVQYGHWKVRIYSFIGHHIHGISNWY